MVAVMLKLGGRMVSGRTTDCVGTPLLVPFTVNVEFPEEVEALSVSVSVAVPDVAMEAGEKLYVTPVGNPVTERSTVPLNPFSADTVTV